jgi:hypothetical protein
MRDIPTTNFAKLLGVIAAAIAGVGLFAPGIVHAEEDSTTRRYALIVANNDSVDTDVEPLEYADDDGARYFELFASFADETRLLTTLDSESQRIFPEIARQTVPPTRPELDRAVRELASDITQARQNGHDTELYLVFTGHGDVDETGEGYLSLGNSKLYRRDIYRKIIEPLDAGFTHLVVDACHAYFMVHPRGGDSEQREGDQWRDDRSGETLNEQLAAYMTKGGSRDGTARPTVGVIASTTGSAEVHEWSRYRAGVFSHQLRSGLVGAADADGDGAITYRELEAYLVAANAAVTNPRARLDVYAHPPEQNRARPLTTLDGFEESTILEIPAGRGGRYYLEDSRGVRYADFHVDAATATRIALLREPLDGGSYYLVHGDQQAEIPLDGLAVQSPELAFRSQPRQSRGSIDEAFRSNLFETPFGPSFVAGFEAGRSASPAGGAAGHTRRADPNHWRLEASFDYGAGPTLPLRRTSGADRPPEHHLGAQAIFRHTSGWGLGPFADYGGSFFAGERRHHRLSGGLEGSYRFEIVPGVDLVPAIEAGHTGYLVRDDRLRSDPVGLHTGLSVAVDWRVSRNVSVFARPSLDADLYTIDHDDRPNRERWFLTPIGRLGVSFHGP